MDKNKLTNLANSFSLSCKQVVKDNKLAQKLVSSPALMLTALTVLEILVDDGLLDKGKNWGSTG